MLSKRLLEYKLRMVKLSDEYIRISKYGYWYVVTSIQLLICNQAFQASSLACENDNFELLRKVRRPVWSGKGLVVTYTDVKVLN